MGYKEKHDEFEQIVDCDVCDGVISLEVYMEIGDIVCCEECGTEYIFESRKPLYLEPLEEEDEGDDDHDLMSGFDDDYNDGRYD